MYKYIVDMYLFPSLFYVFGYKHCFCPFSILLVSIYLQLDVTYTEVQTKGPFFHFFFRLISASNNCGCAYSQSSDMFYCVLRALCVPYQEADDGWHISVVRHHVHMAVSCSIDRNIATSVVQHSSSGCEKHVTTVSLRKEAFRTEQRYVSILHFMMPCVINSLPWRLSRSVQTLRVG